MKRSKLNLLVCFMLIFAVCLTFGIMPLTKVRAAHEYPANGKLLYYVDCGNLVDSDTGIGSNTNRGTVGYPNKVATTKMAEMGVSFPTSSTVAGSELYNSVTDNVYGVDAVSGYSWGFVEYGSWNEWRYGRTASSVSGFDSYRQINESKGEGTLVYKFQVDDAETALTVKMGFRTPAGWTGKQSTIVINGDNKGTVSVPSEEDHEETYENIIGVLADDGKYYVTIETGLNDENAFVNFIMISTANWVPGKNVTYNANGFVVKGSAPTLTSSENEVVEGEVSLEDQAKIDNANILDTVIVDVKVKGADTVIESCSVVVLPASYEYLVNVGDKGDGNLLLGDAVYSAETGYGYTDENGTASWQGYPFNESIRYNDKNHELLYQFDVENGAYAVYFGSISYWSMASRTSNYALEGGEVKEYVALAGGSTFIDGAIVSDGQLNVAFTKGAHDPLITFILVAKAHQVTFDANNGTDISTSFHIEGERVAMPKTPVKEAEGSIKYLFEKWVNAETNEEYDFSAPLTSDITLKAVYTIPTNPEDEKLLYYVDCGNLVDSDTGIGSNTNRGTIGYPNKVATTKMAEMGVAFPTSSTVAGNELYNSLTDKVYGFDDVTGYSWGFAEYGSWNEWRYGRTASSVSGFDSYRQINESGNEGTLIYTFQVDNAETVLTVKMGFRAPSGWDGKKTTVVINGENRGTVSVPSNADYEEVYTNVTGVLANDGNYYVTIAMGQNSQNAFVNFIMVQTANWIPDKNVTYTANGFVVKGNAPTLISSENEIVEGEVSAEDQAKIDNAENFGTVIVNVKVKGSETVVEACSIVVLPVGCEYFVNVGDKGDGSLLLGDAVYSAETGYGYTDESGTSGWVGSPYNESIRYNDKNNELLYQFDVENGTYVVYFGSISYWGMESRTSKYALESGEVKEYVALEGGSIFRDGVIVSDGQLNIAFTKGSDAPLITFILIAKGHQVSFDADNGSAVSSLYHLAGEKVAMPEAPAKETVGSIKYIFEKWVNAETNEEYDFNAPLTGNIVLKAVYKEEAVTFTVDFCDDEGFPIEGLDKQFVSAGAKVVKPADPVKSATAQYTYTFAGWFNGENAWDFENDVVTGNMFLVAVFTEVVNTYAVNFVDENGNAIVGIDAQEIAYGAKVSAPANPEKAATAQYTYTFAGWFNGENAWDFENAVVEGAITLTAKFTEVVNTYAVNFVDENGNAIVGIDAQEVAYGAKVSAPANPEKAATAQYTYTFAGWFNGENAWDFENAVVEGAITLTAKFTEVEREYVLTIIYADGSETQAQTYLYGAMADLDFAREGFTFVVTLNGAEITELQIVENVEITVTYTPARTLINCSGTIGGGSLAFLAVIAIAFVCKKRR